MDGPIVYMSRWDKLCKAQPAYGSLDPSGWDHPTTRARAFRYSVEQLGLITRHTRHWGVIDHDPQEWDIVCIIVMQIPHAIQFRRDWSC